MHVFCLDICFAAQRLCQFSSRRLLLVLVGRSLERLKPWRWLSCFKRVSWDSLTKQACEVGPKAQWNANKEPTALTNRLSCFLMRSIVSMTKTWFYQNLPHFVLNSFPENRLQRNKEQKLWCWTSRQSSAFLFSLKKWWQGMRYQSDQRAEGGDSAAGSVWNSVPYVLNSPTSSCIFPRRKIFTSERFKGNKTAHFGDLDEAKTVSSSLKEQPQLSVHKVINVIISILRTGIKITPKMSICGEINECVRQ